MSSALSHCPTALVPGEIAFVASDDLPAHLSEAETMGLLAVELPAPTPAARGRLGVALEAAIEGALLRRGACAPGIGAAASLDASLNDQIYRARLLELRGLAIGLSTLSGIADLRGALDPDDGWVLRFFIDATHRAPVRLLFDQDNRRLALYGAPEPLVHVVTQHGRGQQVQRDESPLVAPEVAASSATMELSEPPPAVFERDGALAFEQALEEPPLACESSERAESSVDAVLAEQAAEPERERKSSPLPIGDIAEAIVRSLGEPESTRPPTVAEQAAPVQAERTPVVEPSGPSEPRPRALDAAAVRVPPLYPNAANEWRGWLCDLQAARGPRPLAVIERMFVTSYVPLRNALLHGLAEEDAARALDSWSASFAQSYQEAFEALRVRGKRPSMVLDVPELALRIGRLHGARSVQLLLVDGLRFDLGLRVEQRVRALVGQQAALTERLLLWSALPSTTEAQLELIGRGPEGLREPLGEPESEIPVARGRAASTLRRVKTGHRELLKLDVVEARLGETGPGEAERLDQLADEAATAISEHLVKQMPRTLVMAFGDHGFLLDRL
ncbi:MAG TPA: hypothetical protein VG937_24835, partial [Polyangiaceae bacterium]|nr:hypothetical protein [Polyangiaceae bacterium]